MALLTVKKTGKASEAATFLPEEVPTSTSEILVPTGLELKVEASVSCVSFKTTGAAKVTMTKGISLTGTGKSLELSAETTVSVSVAGGFNLISGSAGATTEPVTNGVDVKALTVKLNATGKAKLSEKLTASIELAVKVGVLETAGFEVVCGRFIGETASTKELIAGASIIKCTASGTALPAWSPSASMTISAGTSTIELTATESAFEGQALTYNIVKFTGEVVTIFQSSTFATLSLALTGSVRVVIFAVGTATTVTTLSKSAGALELKSKTNGEVWKLKKASGTAELEEAKIRDSTAEGGAAFKDVNGENISNNTGWTFETTSTAVRPNAVV